MDPIVCREALATLLSQEAAGLDTLAALLEREHALIVANDVEALESVMAERQACVGSLLRAEEERRSLCRMHGREPDAKGIEGLMTWCDPRGSLKAAWERCAQGATRCRELNDRNGALVAARMKRVENLLTVLTGQPQDASTYGPKGGTGAIRSGRVLSTEA